MTINALSIGRVYRIPLRYLVDAHNRNTDENLADRIAKFNDNKCSIDW